MILKYLLLEISYIRMYNSLNMFEEIMFSMSLDLELLSCNSAKTLVKTLYKLLFSINFFCTRNGLYKT